MYLTDNQQKLMDAVLDNNQRKVSALLKKGVDPDFVDNDNTPLEEAIRNSNLAMVKALVTAGADINRSGGYGFVKERPLDIADRLGDAKIIEFLEQQGAQSSDSARVPSKQRALFDAVVDNDTRKVAALLNKGIDPDFAVEDEATPLDEAIRRGNLAIVRALVDAGADVNRVNSYKEAPLDVAKQVGDIPVTQYLESEGAVTGKPSGGKPAHNTGVAGGFKSKGRGRSTGFDDDWGDDFYDDDKYYFGADEDEGRKGRSGVKPKVRAKNGIAQSAAPEAAPPEKKQKPVFREDTLKDIFNAKNWVGKADEMEQLWNEVPKRLQKHFDFAASLAEARRETLKQNAPKKVMLQNAPRPAQSLQPPKAADAPADVTKQAALKPPEPPKP